MREPTERDGQTWVTWRRKNTLDPSPQPVGGHGQVVVMMKEPNYMQIRDIPDIIEF